MFNFGNYQLVLDFGWFVGSGVIGGFNVEFTDNLTDEATIGSRYNPAYVCVPINGLGSGPNCVEFSMSAPLPVQGTNFTGDYRIDVVWSALTDPLYPDAPGGRIHLLHDSSLSPGNFFGSDITIPGSYFVIPPCGNFPTTFCGDPGIGGRDNNFQNFIVVHDAAAVPEPATMVLIGSGLAGLVVRRRRQRS